MTEEDYILATDLAKARVALSTLSDLINPPAYVEAARATVGHWMHDLEAELDKKRMDSPREA